MRLLSHDRGHLYRSGAARRNGLGCSVVKDLFDDFLGGDRYAKNDIPAWERVAEQNNRKVSVQNISLLNSIGFNR